MDTEDDPGPAIGSTGARFGGAPRRRRTARRRAAEAAGAPAEPPAAPDDDTKNGPKNDPEIDPENDTVAIAAVGPAPGPGAARPGVVPPGTHHAGARQHGAPAMGTPSGEPVPDTETADGPLIGLTGARFGGSRLRRPAPGPAPRPAGTPASDGRPAAPEEEPSPPDEWERVAGGSAFVRPYVFTRGRTRSSFELSIETLVSAVPRSTPARVTGEHQIVLDLCREPRSVAELAARAGVPLGVARVLVGDLAAAGAVAVHRSVGEAGPDLALMQRVLAGLRNI